MPVGWRRREGKHSTMYEEEGVGLTLKHNWSYLADDCFVVVSVCPKLKERAHWYELKLFIQLLEAPSATP